MVPWDHLDTAQLPGGGEMRLFRRGEEFSIRLGIGVELMNSRQHGSEEALAQLAIARLGGRPHPHVLVGGLGMGFTLRAALDVLPPGGRVTVAELVPELVGWARGPLAPVVGGLLDDPRVAVRVGDVGAAMREGPFDAILLDVDNGPEALTVPSNDELYGPAGLEAARAALHPGGVLAVWSVAPDERFTRRVERAGFAVETVQTRARGSRGGARHVIWLATRAREPRSRVRGDRARPSDGGARRSSCR